MQLRFRDDVGIIPQTHLRAQECARGVDHAARLQELARDDLRALRTVDALDVGRQLFAFRLNRLPCLSSRLSRSEWSITPMELSDMAAAQMDGCSSPVAATGMLMML